MYFKIDSQIAFDIVLTEDGNSEHFAHVWFKISNLRKQFDDSFDVAKCLQQIEIPNSEFHKCA